MRGAKGSTMLSRLMLVIASFAVCPHTCRATNLVIRDNGYENLLVAINNNVPENPRMIPELKSMFTEASAFMHVATRRRAYIRNITILLPETWEDNPQYEDTGRETFPAADIRIDSVPSPADSENGPYTRQIGWCGDPGEYILLTPAFVLDMLDRDDGKNREQRWGPVGKVLVHEFAHLRWGVFDEYVAGNSQRCTERIPAACGEGDGTDLPAECDKNSSTPTASIMYKQFLGSIDSFCESDTDDPFLKHNLDMRNPQNSICGKGTWDVISKHSDFANGTNTTVEIKDTVPSFRMIYPRPRHSDDGGVICRRLVLVMDISGSMKGERIFKLGQTANRLIQDILPLGMELGMVVFTSSARIWQPITLLRNISDKATMINLLPRNRHVGGGTNIGAGMLKGIELLKKGEMSADGSIVFLISDGRSASFKHIFDEVVSSGVIVYTVAYTSAAADELAKLSDLTGGIYYADSGGRDSTSLDGAITAQLAAESQCQNDRRQTVELTRSTASLTGATVWSSGSLLVDSSIGNGTLFSFSYPESTSIEVTLTGPSAQYDKESSEYSQDDQFNIIRIRIPDAESGIWTFNITKTGAQSKDVAVVVTVISYPREGEEPIVAKAFMSRIDVSFGNDKAAIYAEVTKGYLPIVKANVVATVDRPAGGTVKVTLLDNGQGVDVAKDDGVYSAYFTDFSGNGEHSVDVTISTNEDTSVKTFGTSTGGSAQRVTHYELRRAESFDELRKNFSESLQINVSFVVPLPAGSQERVSVQLPYNISLQERHIFGVRAFDDVLNVGEVSNLVVVVKIEEVTVGRDRTETESTVTTVMPHRETVMTVMPHRETVMTVMPGRDSDELDPVPIIVGVIGGVAALILIGVVVFVALRPSSSASVDVTRKPHRVA